jgi:hypothetical protein
MYASISLRKPFRTVISKCTCMTFGLELMGFLACNRLFSPKCRYLNEGPPYVKYKF